MAEMIRARLDKGAQKGIFHSVAGVVVANCAGLPATVAFTVTDFNRSSEFSMLCQRAWSFFVSIGAKRSE
jgi:hypothetical protein